MLSFQTLLSQFKTTDERPSIFCSDIENATFNQMRFDIDKSAESVFVFDNVRNAVISNSEVDTEVNYFLKVNDDFSRDIYLMNNVLSKSKRII